MLTVAYLANEFPSAVEPYVTEEIEELRGRGVRVIAGSVRTPLPHEAAAAQCMPQIVLRPPRLSILLRALALSIRKRKCIWPLISRIAFQGREGLMQRLKALAHTWLGACYAVLLRSSVPEHIHVHHGYLGSWIAMVAARLLEIRFSMTLHGSDLLLHPTFLDVKLENCSFCLTVSDYNRNYILQRYPRVKAEKVAVMHLGVDVPQFTTSDVAAPTRGNFTILAVGRLHQVKDHAFLIRACAQVQANNIPFRCLIVGGGPERRKLESLIREFGLQGRVTLMGHVPRSEMNSWYEQADAVVLTSRSEGIPLVLMEAMARRKVVLAPNITGIPELVTAGKNGFLYSAGSLDDFVAKLISIYSLLRSLQQNHLEPSIPFESRRLQFIRRAAQAQVRNNFNREKRLQSFGDFFLRQVAPLPESLCDEDPILQQI